MAAPHSQHRRVFASLGAALLIAAASLPARAGAQGPARCSDDLHASITATGPDGRAYPTWHPPVHESGCYFGHEDGADPRTSRANPALPPFGYVAAQAGEQEPHEGFKVFVANAGTRSDEGKVAQADSRIVFHMGTSGIGRYATRLHSMMFDYRHADGRRVSLQGMADTGTAVGSTCDRPRRGGRDFSTVGCPDSYEIWTVRFLVMHPSDPYVGLDQSRAGLATSVAAFDPITTRVPGDDRRLLYTETYRNGATPNDPMSPLARYRGCDREAYDGPVYWNNARRPTTYYTDAYGRVQPSATALAPGLLKQEVSATPRSRVDAFKYRERFCHATVRAPN